MAPRTGKKKPSLARATGWCVVGPKRPLRADHAFPTRAMALMDAPVHCFTSIGATCESALAPGYRLARVEITELAARDRRIAALEDAERVAWAATAGALDAGKPHIQTVILFEGRDVMLSVMDWKTSKVTHAAYVRWVNGRCEISHESVVSAIDAARKGATS